MLRARPFSAVIRSAQGEAPARTFQIAVGNGRHYGGGNVVSERAAIDDGQLDLYSLEMSTVWKMALMLPAFRAGAHGAWSEVRTARCAAFDVLTRRPKPVNADGEIVTATPAHFRVHPAAVRIFAPQGVAPARRRGGAAA
ncbi:hypothetical protein ACFFJB_10915 [Camelimonas abortus]|uniref:YegS/DAGK C-terminal domain-containing protein n=1 Tax=Camelimonas abortus TaxID=1017184 RepID=A0ABV7LC32_9HYPH